MLYNPRQGEPKITVEDGGKRLREGQTFEDRLREIRGEEGWVCTDDEDWKERLSKRMNDESR